MGYCDRCGTLLSGDSSGMCTNCESSSRQGTGTPADVPCQRCGMYLPSHELQMWNSRLYCAYCIMDVKDEEKSMRTPQVETPRVEVPQSEAPRAEQRKPDDLKLAAESGKLRGVCPRCGRATNQFYYSQGRPLCLHCYSETGEAQPGGNSPSSVGQVAVSMREAIRSKGKPESQKPKSQEQIERKLDIGALLGKVRRRLSKKKEQ